MSRLRDRAPAALVALLVTVTGFAVADDVVPDACQKITGALEVSVSTEKSTALAEMAAQYGTDHRAFTVDGTAYCGEVEVSSLTSGSAEKALESGWTDRAFTQDEPPPEVWLPSASIWPELLAANTGKPVPESAGSLARSPLVLGLPLRKAQALRAHLRGRFDWSLLQKLVGEDNVPLSWNTGVLAGGDPAWGRFHLKKDDPIASTSGLAAVVTAYQDLHRSYPGWKIGDDKMNQAFRKLEALVSEGGYTSDSTEMMRQLAVLDTTERGWGADTSGVILQESLLYQYDTHSLGGSAPATDPEQLVPFYSATPLDMDHPYVLLPALDEKPLRRALADDFADFLLKDPYAHQKFAEAGMRDPRGARRAGLVDLDTKLRGLDGLPDAPVVQQTVPAGDWPDAPVVRQIRGMWQATRKRAHVLLLVDESLTMKEHGRMDQARDAVRAAVETWTTPNDRVALWGFSATKGDRSAAVTRQLMGWHPGGASRALETGIVALTPRSDTPLFRAIGQAREEVADQPSVDESGEWANVVVVMTDGEDDFLNDPASLAYARDNDVPVYAVAFGPKADRAVADLRAITGATHGGYQDAIDPVALDRAFSALIRVA